MNRLKRVVATDINPDSYDLLASREYLDKVKSARGSNDVIRCAIKKVRESLLIAVGAKRFTNFASAIRDKVK